MRLHWRADLSVSVALGAAAIWIGLAVAPSGVRVSIEARETSAAGDPTLLSKLHVKLGFLGCGAHHRFIWFGIQILGNMCRVVRVRVFIPRVLQLLEGQAVLSGNFLHVPLAANNPGAGIFTAIHRFGGASFDADIMDWNINTAGLACGKGRTLNKSVSHVAVDSGVLWLMVPS
jgi:hypothetical protein